MSSRTVDDEPKSTARCVVCHKEFESAGTLGDVILEAQGIKAPPMPSTGAGVCSMACGLKWFGRRMRGEVD